MALRLVTEEEQTLADPVEELKEGIEVLGRLSTNPLLSDSAQGAIEASESLLRFFLPLPGLPGAP
jgi:hypothetical protein